MISDRPDERADATSSGTASATDALRILGVLSADARLRAFAAVTLGARTSRQVTEWTGLGGKDALRALAQLEAEALVAREADGWVARPERLRTVIIESSPAMPEVDPEDPAADASTAAVLRAFMRDGRLETIPAQRQKRLVVLEYLARAFEPGVYYSEKEVSATLRGFHQDFATLRRYLVDEGYLSRAHGSYWRTGGPVEV